MSQPAIEQAFDTFATAQDSQQRYQALSDLMTLKAVPKQADDPRFGQGLMNWQALLGNESATDADRLLAIAELIRAGQTIKKLQPKLGKMIAPAFAKPLPPASLLKEATDRLNLARACSLMPADWMPAYLAQSVAEEETGEKPRAEAMNILMDRVGSVADLLSLLADAFANLRIQTESPADSIGRRLTRTLAVMRPVLIASFIEVGEATGARLEALLRTALRSTGRPQEERVRLELTREVALTIHDLVRTHFSISTESETFSALKYCRGFFTGISWPSEVREPMAFLVQDVSEALIMLGRQDVPNQGMLDQLEVVCGNKDRARGVSTELAAKHTELPERIRDWLKRGRLAQTISASDTLEDSLLRATEPYIGLALIEARRLKDQEDTATRIVSTLEIFDPTLAPGAQGYVAQTTATIAAVEEVAKRREIDLLGALGEEIEFTPKYFEPIGPISGRRATVRRPAIVRRSVAGAPSEVILKGLVE